MNILGAIKREEQKIEKQVSKLRRELEGVKAAAKALGDSASNEIGKARKRVMSAAARAKISAAAKRRWAKERAGAKKGTVREAANDGLGTARKRVMSAAARAKISAAMKKRWARAKAGAKRR